MTRQAILYPASTTPFLGCRSTPLKNRQLKWGKKERQKTNQERAHHLHWGRYNSHYHPLCFSRRELQRQIGRCVASLDDMRVCTSTMDYAYVWSWYNNCYHPLCFSRRELQRQIGRCAASLDDMRVCTFTMDEAYLWGWYNNCYHPPLLFKERAAKANRKMCGKPRWHEGVYFHDGLCLFVRLIQQLLSPPLLFKERAPKANRKMCGKPRWHEGVYFHDGLSLCVRLIQQLLSPPLLFKERAAKANRKMCARPRWHEGVYFYSGLASSWGKYNNCCHPSAFQGGRCNGK